MYYSTNCKKSISMNISKFKFVALVLFIALLSSCENYLDPGYDEYLDKSEVFSSYTYSLGYVRTVYSYLPGADYSEAFMSDEAKHTDQKSSYIDMNNGVWTSRSYVGSGTWSHYYAGIRRVHIFLANVDSAIFLDPNSLKLTPQINDTLRKQYKAEVRFLRAFYYFELLKRFGDPTINLGVPIVPEKVLNITDQVDFSRNSYDSCVSYILNDCDSAAKVLPVRWINADYGRVSKAAALALKSRLLLYAASPLANPTGDVEKWKAAAAAAKAVLDLPGYSLLASTGNMLPIFSQPNNNEILFCGPVIQSNYFEQNNLPPGIGGGGQINPTQELVNAFETARGSLVNVAEDGSLTSTDTRFIATDPYEKRDPRLKFFIGINGTTINTYNSKNSVIESYVGGKDGPDLYTTSTKTGYYIRKFMDPAIDIWQGRAVANHIWVFFRLAETYLNYAEAMAQAYGVTNKPAGYTLSAYDAIKKVRDRAFGASSATTALQTMSVDDFLSRVRNERRVELCFEGHRYWDVRRWKLGEQYFNAPIHGVKIVKNGTNFTYSYFKVEDRVFDTKMYVMPIPYDEVQKSKLLVQNTGW